MLIVKIEKNNLNRALKTLRRKVKLTKQLKTLRDKKAFTKKSDRLREMKQKAIYKQRMVSDEI
jgi:small subunit ribosomal protein S21|tara:strand:- start:867 stop:1055 length:189 start_codon:yes stop_codon:yes gene_type:complete